MACADMGKNKKEKGRKLKGKIYIGGRRGKQYFILLYTTFLDFVRVCFVLSINTGGIAEGETFEIRMARKDFVALFDLYIYKSLSI